MIRLANITFDGVIANPNRKPYIREEIETFTGTFAFGKAYLLHASIGKGAWALAQIISGVIPPHQGTITLNGKHYSWRARRASSWLVRHDEIRRFGLFRLSVKSQIKHGLRQTPYDENMIKQKFALTPERCLRRLSQLSSEGWRASCAIGFANGKEVFCFPHIDYLRPKLIDEYKDLWFKDMIRFLTASGALVLVPTSEKQHSDMFDDIYEFE